MPRKKKVASCAAAEPWEPLKATVCVRSESTPYGPCFARKNLRDIPDLAAADRGNVEIGLAYQQRAELGLAQRPEELGKPAAGHVEFHRLLVVAKRLELQIARRRNDQSHTRSRLRAILSTPEDLILGL